MQGFNFQKALGLKPKTTGNSIPDSRQIPQKFQTLPQPKPSVPIIEASPLPTSKTMPETEPQMDPYEKFRHTMKKVHQLETHDKPLAEKIAMEALREWFSSDYGNEVKDEEENGELEQNLETEESIEEKDHILQTQVEIQEDKDNEQCQLDPLEEEKEEYQNLAKTAAQLAIEDYMGAEDELSSDLLCEIILDYIGVEEEEDMEVRERTERFCRQIAEQQLKSIASRRKNVEVVWEDELPTDESPSILLVEEKNSREPLDGHHEEEFLKEERIDDPLNNLVDEFFDLLNDACEDEGEDWIMNGINGTDEHDLDACIRLGDEFIALVDETLENKDGMTGSCVQEEYPKEENFIVIKEKTNEYRSEERMEAMYQKESPGEEESIFLDIEPQISPEWNMQELSFKEFLDARHLRIYLESKVDGEKGLVSTQSSEDCDSRG